MTPCANYLILINARGRWFRAIVRLVAHGTRGWVRADRSGWGAVVVVGSGDAGEDAVREAGDFFAGAG